MAAMLEEARLLFVDDVIVFFKSLHPITSLKKELDALKAWQATVK